MISACSLTVEALAVRCKNLDPESFGNIFHNFYVASVVGEDDHVLEKSPIPPGD